MALFDNVEVDRRRDECTEKSIDDSLRARGTSAAAQALAYQNVRPDLALRVLGRPRKRRAAAGTSSHLTTQPKAYTVRPRSAEGLWRTGSST